MSKRRLTHRQSSRIQDRLAQRRERAATGETTDETLGPEQEGLLISLYRQHADVLSQDGHHYRCQIRQNLGDLVSGDRVIWREAGQGTGVIVAICPRHTILGRPDRRGQMKPIAANVDQMLIVIAPDPAPVLSLIDSYLIATQTLHIKPTLVLNKMDRVTREFEQVRAIYQPLGYDIIETSTYQSHGLDALRHALAGVASVFVGQSGVGKSSLIKALLPDEDIKVGELSEAGGHGAHTTSTTRLYHLISGAIVIDSPGIREFGLWEMSPQELGLGFIEFHPFLNHCKYRDCHHTQEPDCAIKAAVHDGKICRARYESYLRLANK